jgi:hypothetical protein
VSVSARHDDGSCLGHDLGTQCQHEHDTSTMMAHPNTGLPNPLTWSAHESHIYITTNPNPHTPSHSPHPALLPPPSLLHSVVGGASRPPAVPPPANVASGRRPSLASALASSASVPSRRWPSCMRPSRRSQETAMCRRRARSGGGLPSSASAAGRGGA